MKFKNIVLGIGIIIVFGLALWQGVEAFYPSPEYDQYCNITRQVGFINSSEQCQAVGGLWQDYNYEIPKSEAQGFCDIDYYCRQDFEEAQKSHSSYVFIISIIVAVIAFILGYFLLSTEPVGSALIGSGIWAIFWGSAVNWRNFSNIWRFLLLLLALILLIWFALRLNKPGKSKWMFWK